MKILEVTLWRATKIWWSLFWRSMLYVMLISLPIGMMLGLIAASLKMTAIPESYFQVLGVVIGVPIWIWVIRIVFEKQFSDFQIVLIEPLENLLDDDQDTST